MSIWSFGDVVPGHRVRPGWHFITQSRAICDGIRTWARPLLVRLTGLLELTGALAACQPRTLTLASSCRLSTSPASTLNPTRSCCGTCGRRSRLCWMRPTPSEREYQKKEKKKRREQMLFSDAVSVPALQRMAASEVPGCNGCTLVRSTWEGSGGCSRGGRERRSLWPRRTTALLAEGWIDTCEENKHKWVDWQWFMGAIFNVNRGAVEGLYVGLFPTEPQNCYFSSWMGARPVTAGSQPVQWLWMPIWSVHGRALETVWSLFWSICFQGDTKCKLFLAWHIYKLGVINWNFWNAIKAQL